MRYRLIFALSLAALTAGAADAQQATYGAGRAAGTVKSITATEIVLVTANGDVNLAITPKTRVVVSRTADVKEIKPGAYLGTSNRDGAAPGTGTATEVHLMESGPNVNTPMNDSGLTMTNGHVTNVTTTDKGQEMEIDYGQDTKRHVVISKETSMTRMVDVGIAGLKPGVEVSAFTNTRKDGKATTTFISVTTPEAK
jgi:hypothetical protein